MPPTQQQPPPQQTQPGGGGTAAVAAAPDVLAALAPALAAKLTGDLTAEGAQQIAEALTKAVLLAATRTAASRAVYLAAILPREYPDESDKTIQKAIADEERFEALFRDATFKRLLADLPGALAITDPEARAAAVQAILDREKLYAQQHEVAAAERVRGRLEVALLQRLSPEGAYWKLSPFVKEHTPDCLAMAEKFWPWEVLRTTHPPLHPGCPCALFGVDEAVQRGWMTHDQVPDKDEAVARAARVLRIAKEIEDGDLGEALWTAWRDMEESPYLAENVMRWPKGYAHGGEFRPERGGDPGAAIKKKLHGLLDVPESPTRMRARGAHRWQYVAGHYTKVPVAERWTRTRGGHTYESPPGTSEVFKDGRPLTEPDRMRRSPGVSLTDDTAGHVRTARHEGRQAAVKRARAAVARLDHAHSPLEAGAGPEGVLALTDAGFKLHRADTRAEGTMLRFRHESGAKVNALWDGNRVTGLDWMPHPAPGPKRQAISGPPQSWDQHRGDALAWADELGERFGAPVNVTDVRATATLSDHAGQHDWAGDALVGQQARHDIEGAATARVDDAPLSDWQRRGVWAAYHVTAHEIAHGVNPIGEDDFEGANANLEEALTEEAAHVLAVERLTEQGQGDVLEWRARNRDSLPVQGLYRPQRGALGMLFDQAGVEDPVKRHDLVMRLKFQTPPEQRLDVLAGMVAKHMGVDPDIARDHVEMTMEESDGRDGQVVPFAAHSPGRAQVGTVGYGRFPGGKLSDDGRVLYLKDGSRRVVEKRAMDKATRDAVKDFPVDKYGRAWSLAVYPPAADEPRDFRYVDSEERAKRILRAFVGKGLPSQSNEASDDFKHLVEPKAPPASPGFGPQKGFWDELKAGLHFGGGAPKDAPTNAPKDEPKKKPKEPPKPVTLGGKKVPGPTGAVPSYDSVHLTLGKHAGGSTGARIAAADDGTKYLVKTYGGNEDRVATELLANAIYRQMGAKVARAGTIETPDGRTALTYPLLDGKPHAIREPSKELGEHFMTDALLANWDFVGLTDDNVLWDPEGTPFRVDQGGTMFFRAQGAPKPFGPVPTEVWTLISPKGQGFGKVGVTQDEMRAQAGEIAKRLTPAKIDKLVAQVPFEDEKLRDNTAAALKARVGWMRDFADGKEPYPGPLEGADARAALADGQQHVRPYPEQENAVYHLVADPEEVNDPLREQVPKGDTDPAVADTIKELDSLLRHVKTNEDVWASVGFNPGEDPEGLVGKTLQERGYLALTTADERTHAKPATLRVLLPKGTNAAYLPAMDIPELPPDPEIIVRRNQRVKITGVREEGGRTYVDAVAL